MRLRRRKVSTRPTRDQTLPFWHGNCGEFILKYDDVRASETPDQEVLDFFQRTYEAAANLGDWDRAELERVEKARE